MVWMAASWKYHHTKMSNEAKIKPAMATPKAAPVATKEIQPNNRSLRSTFFALRRHAMSCHTKKPTTPLYNYLMDTARFLVKRNLLTKY